jgi:hypothetical protein
VTSAKAKGATRTPAIMAVIANLIFEFIAHLLKDKPQLITS